MYFKLKLLSGILKEALVLWVIFFINKTNASMIKFFFDLPDKNKKLLQEIATKAKLWNVVIEPLPDVIILRGEDGMPMGC